MKILSLDIETTGIDHDEDLILSLGAILEDTNNIKPIDELPKFHIYVDYNRLVGDLIGITMNQKNLEKIIQLRNKAYSLLNKSYVDKLVNNTNELSMYFNEWISQHATFDNNIVIAGKNVARFDLPFLESKVFGKNYFYSSSKFSKRTIDPSVYFIDWSNEVLPSTELCLARAGIKSDVQHDALGDCINVIKLIRHATNNYTK